MHHLDADGNVIRREPNGGLSQEIPMSGATFRTGKGRFIDVNALDRPTVATKNDDDALFEAYLKHKNVSGYGEREVRHLWSLFKTLTDGKPLKDCTRDDGRKLVAHLEAQGLKSASVRRKINWLRAACIR